MRRLAVRAAGAPTPLHAALAACDDCAHLISNPEPSEDGIRMAIMHIGYVPQFEALGWITTRSRPHEPPDCCCPHYHALYWEGGHGDDCCGLAT
jgi:hypothetical protein